MATETKYTDSETRQRIVETAAELFPQYGVKGVSMDDLARQLSMSKRTLYEYFTDKEELLLTCIEYNQHYIENWAHEVSLRSETVLNVFLGMYCELVPKMKNYSPKFHEDMKKYPKALSMIQKSKKQQTAKMVDFFQVGIEHGLFLPGINYRVVIQMMVRLLDTPLSAEMTAKYPVSEIRSLVLLTMLRGACTEKGRKIFDDYITDFREEQK